MEFLIKDAWKEPLRDAGLLFARVSVGLLMIIEHGWPKLANFSQRAESFPDPLGVGSQLSLTMAVGAEVFASILLILGLFTRAAALPLIITMAVIVFLVQGGNPFAEFRSRELALVFGFFYMMFLLTGPGRFSLDHFLEKWWIDRKA